jgi:hypothetical protein
MKTATVRIGNSYTLPTSLFGLTITIRWVNQNNFYRQIRNFRIDMRNMDNRIKKGALFRDEVQPGMIVSIRCANYSYQRDFPVGIHWQVSQTCTLQNIEFLLPQGGNSRHIGIFQENGSGGFISDLTFIGGKYCWIAGSQQYTGRNIKFRGCEYVASPSIYTVFKRTILYSKYSC